MNWRTASLGMMPTSAREALILSPDRLHSRRRLEAAAEGKMQIDVVGEQGVTHLDHIRLHGKLRGLELQNLQHVVRARFVLDGGYPYGFAVLLEGALQVL